MMKKSHPWHETIPGKAALWLGSIQLAVPILVLTAAALGWGTWLDSTRNAKVAKAVVYGSWWFMAIMGLVCTSLVFAVVTRYPWKRRHVGFITVHAGIIALIVGGFWSMLGRVEGRLALEAGNSANTIEMDDERLELAEHAGGGFTTLGGTTDPAARPLPVSFTWSGIPVQVVEHWDNTREDQDVLDDAPLDFRGVQVQLGPVAESAVWVGDEAQSGGPLTVMGLTIRVLPDGANWEPPAPAAATPRADDGYFFILDNKKVPLAAGGAEAFPGWTITSIRRFARATVGADGLVDSPSAPENAAVEVVISDGKGNSERHTAFPRFPDMPMSKSLTGTVKSGATLAATGAAPAPTGETIVIYGRIGDTKVGYVGADGVGRAIPASGALPWTLDLGPRKVILRQQFAHARSVPRFVKAPKADQRRPALVLRVGDSPEPLVVPWKANTPVDVVGRTLVVRYGPTIVQLPFSVRLDEFRKTDYPGTEMAMAYESDVSVSIAGGQDHPYTISMNNPYAALGWKVYQSGFLGSTISIFSVMRDPGLPLTYVGAIVLCVGILLTFYSRTFSWGHPGIPVATLSSDSESSNGALSQPSAPAPRAAPCGVPAGAGVA